MTNINGYPYPIAHAWRLAHDENYGATVRHINAIGCFYQCLRLCALGMAGWYIYRLPEHPAMRRALQQLTRPMMGQWLSFIRTAIRNIYVEASVEQYEPLAPLVRAISALERQRWPISALAPNPMPELYREAIGDRLPSGTEASTVCSEERLLKSALSPFAWFIQHRNTHHGHFATLSDKEVSHALDGVLPKLDDLVQSLSCFCDYQLVHRDSGSGAITLLHGDEGRDFAILTDIPDSLFNAEGFMTSREQVALIYPKATMAIPLTLLITREQDNDEFEGFVRFRTATIAHEPLFYEGIDVTRKSVIYLGSGTRSLRSSSFEAVKELFDSHLEVIGSQGELDAIDHLRQEAEAQLSLLYGAKYQPQTYVVRDIDHRLKKELTEASDAKAHPAVLIIGGSGAGKTNLLCHLADELLRVSGNKNQVSLRLAEVIGSGQTVNLEHGLAADLGYKTAGRRFNLLGLFEYWAEANAKRQIKNPRLWILWDALNEGHDLEELLRWAGDAANAIRLWNRGPLSKGQVRLVISCRREPWEELLARTRRLTRDAWPLTHTEAFRWSRDERADEQVPHWILPKFGSKQAQLAYETFRDWASLRHAPHSRIPWSQITAEHRKAMQIPLNCWLFHHTFDGRESLPLGTLGTEVLWQRYLEHTVRRHAPMGRAIEMLGRAMWDGKSPSIEPNQVTTLAISDVEVRQRALINGLGLTLEQFSGLPEAARTALLAQHPEGRETASAIELLYSMGLLLLKQDGSVVPTYQTLGEALASWTVWRELLPRWSPASSEGPTFDDALSAAESDDPASIDQRLAPWLINADWAEGRTALLRVWALRAENALRNGLKLEALKNLSELQLRGCTGMVIDTIESHLPEISDEDTRLQLVNILIDMVHLRGKYKTAASMLEKELSRYSEEERLRSVSLVSMQIRLLHHRMFFDRISELWQQMSYVRSQFNPTIDQNKYGEILFMLGGNLGTLRGNYEEARRYLIEAIRLGTQLQDDYLLCRSLRKYADFQREAGHLSWARRTWENAWAISEKHQQTRQGIYLLCSLGDLERQSGNYEASKESFRKALTSAMESYIPGWTGHCHLGLAELALTQRELSVAEESLNLAGEYYKKVEQSWGNIQVSIGRARLALLRNLPEWRDVGRQAYRDSLRLGYERDCRFIRSLLETSEYRENCLMFL